MKKTNKTPKSAGWSEQKLPEEQLATDGVGGQSRNSGKPRTKVASVKRAFTEFAFGGSMTESPAAKRARTKTRHGWETRT